MSASIFFDALLATIGDLAVGIGLVLVIALIVVLIRSEVQAAERREQEELEAVPVTEEEDIWAGLPDRDRRAAEARFGDEREAA